VLALVLGGAATAVAFFGVVSLLILGTRESAERVECANHQRRIGEAVQLAYDNSSPQAEFRFYPRGALPQPDLLPEARLSWFVELLPYLGPAPERGRWQSLYERVRAAQPWGEADDPGVRDLRVRVFFCPAQPGDLPRLHPGYSSYVGFAGIDPEAADLPTSDPRAGMFGYERVVRAADVAAGTSYTLLATETTIGNGPWLTATRAAFRGLEPEATAYLGPERAFGGCHSGGANCLRVDGSVAFLGNRIHADVFRSLVTLAEDGSE
jgi:prepilin-type processing-associated H-X9-DG protein